jgi:hypothetical protein
MNYNSAWIQKLLIGTIGFGGNYLIGIYSPEISIVNIISVTVTIFFVVIYKIEREKPPKDISVQTYNNRNFDFLLNKSKSG